MRQISVDIPDELFLDSQRYANDAGRTIKELVEEALKTYLSHRTHGEPRHSLLDHKPISLGKVLKPWTSRSEMLEDFFDRKD
jgi:hypothetical protein